MKRKPRNLSADNVHTLDAPVKGNELYGDRGYYGLALRVTAAGDRTFVRNYRVTIGNEIKQKRETLGPLQNKEGTAPRSRDGKRPLTLKEARNLAIERGEAVEKQTAAASSKPATPHNLKTIEGLWKYYDEEVLFKRAPRTRAGYQNMAKNWILPELGRFNTVDVELADMQSLHNTITRAGKRPHANHVLSLCSGMFKEAIKHNIISSNPCVAVERNKFKKSERKPKALTEEQRDLLLEVLAQFGNRPHIQQIVKLLLWTGCRKGELLGARWDEFTLQKEKDKDGNEKYAGVWKIPAERTKQRKEHEVALLTNAAELLTQMQADNASTPHPSDYLFPSNRDGTPHRTNIQWEWADIIEACRKLDSDFPQIGLHSCRHTFATLLVNKEAPLGIISGLLGHSNTQTTSIYAKVDLTGQSRVLDNVGDVLVGGKSADNSEAAR